MWTLFEPIHAVTYFTPEGRSAYEQAGLRGFWRGYFAGRAAPLGAAGPAVVAASFFNFAPAFVARAIPGVWELITPKEALRVRLRQARLRRSDGCWPGRRPRRPRRPGCSGGPSASSTSPAACWPRRTPRCRSPVTVVLAPTVVLGLAGLWQAATLLREHRGDGHFAALAAADIDGCEAVVLRCAWTCDGRTCSRCGAGPTRRGTTPCPGWPRAAGSPRTAR